MLRRTNTRGRRAATALLLMAALTLTGAGAAAAQVEPYGAHTYGTFWNILPAGTNGTANAAQLLQFEANKTRPPHSSDQLAMYHRLTTAAPNITAARIGDFFKDATFGVPAGQIESSESPEPGATILWDSRFGVPHIYGDTRSELEFAVGWATAEKRLFEIDVLRHAGAGDLASFAGGANASMDAGTWQNEPYTQADLQAQLDYIKRLPGGAQVVADGQSYVDGVNAYIAKAKTDPLLLMPSEYAAIGQPTGPQPFQLTDVISIASLIGGQLGQGGGAQLATALLYEQLARRFGPELYSVPGSPEAASTRPLPLGASDHSALATLESFIAPDDPEAPTTVHARRFPYQTLPRPRAINRASVALPDPGSVHYVSAVVGGSAARDVAAGQRELAQPGATTRQGLLGGGFPTSDSNALLVSAAHSSSGRPIAVIGPQVAYWSPEILLEEDIHGGGIDADGASFPGTNIYVELGHGEDYAWSATSEGQNIIDTFAVPLCSIHGGRPSLNSEHYLLRGRCVHMQALTETESWKPNLADSTPAGSVTLRTLRTAYGLVIARATIRGRPVLYTNLRSTYMHELDSATAFKAFNEHDQMRTPAAFTRAAYRIGYTFNWFFINGRHIAYFASGQNPVRARGTDPLFPSWSKYAWVGLRPNATPTPQSTTERDTPPSAHPQAIDQNFLTSWNNKPAPGYNYDDGEYSSVYRSQLLDNNIEHYLVARHGRIRLVDLINAMGNAGTQDLRGVEVLPYALSILGRPRNATAARAVRQLRAWVAAGAHRWNRAHPGASGTYEHSGAIRIMDAWWPLLIRAEFGPVLGSTLLAAVEGRFGIDNLPHKHQGSAWDNGFYGIVQKDLRAAAGTPVAGPLNRIYCGSGSLPACRAALQRSLLKAAAESMAQVYPAGGGCSAGDQMCYDAVHYTAIGAITQPPQEWINRPTFQQVVQISGRAP